MAYVSVLRSGRKHAYVWSGNPYRLLLKPSSYEAELRDVRMKRIREAVTAYPDRFTDNVAQAVSLQ